MARGFGAGRCAASLSTWARRAGPAIVLIVLGAGPAATPSEPAGDPVLQRLRDLESAALTTLCLASPDEASRSAALQPLKSRRAQILLDRRRAAKLAGASEQPSTPPERDGDRVAAVLSRPLFARSRRPQPSQSAVRDGVKTPLPRLTGTLIGPRDKRALFASDDGRTTLAVIESAAVGLWTVDAIMTGSVILNGPGGRREMHVEGAGPAPGVAASAASPMTSSAWTSPCSPQHRRSGREPGSAKEDRCGLLAFAPPS